MTCRAGELIKDITRSSIKNGNLKTLNLGFRLAESMDVPVIEEYPASNTLEELSLAGSILRERRIIDIVNLYPKLSKLNVSNTKITGVAVKHFVSVGIKWLKLDECSEISPDAVEYARGKDVEVEFNFPSRRQIGFRDRVAF
jgi:F-box/TPR repeat protein Pof3